MENIMKPKGFFSRLLTVFFPQRCPCCEKVIHQDKILCEDCIREYNGITYRTYAKGGYPCVSPVPYDGVFSKAILRFKFNNRRQYSLQLANIIAEAVKKEYDCKSFDMITFVPLHKKRFMSRGYNQSELLAQSLSKILDIPVVSTLIKTRNNKPQHTLKATKRSENVKGAYRIIDKKLVANKNILLLDDIITTGATLGECAKTLESCNPRAISCTTFAISVVKNDLK